MSYLRALDIISGQEAHAYLKIDGKNELMFYAKSLTATATKDKIAIKTLGKRGTQYKANGWSGKGSMVIYYATSVFREMMVKYISSGKDTLFNIQVVNNDPASSIGKQDVTLVNVSLDSVVMAGFDVSSDTLEEKVSFTFDDVILGEAFTSPSGVRA